MTKTFTNYFARAGPLATLGLALGLAFSPVPLLSSVPLALGVAAMAIGRFEKKLSDDIHWGIYDGFASVWATGGYAWSFIEGKWLAENDMELFTKMRVLSKAQYDRMFPDVPPPPLRTS